MITNPKLILKEEYGTASTMYDAGDIRELLARQGASYSLLDGSSMSPIPFVEGRQVGSNLELTLPDGSKFVVQNYFGPSGGIGDPTKSLAKFGADTQVYFPDYTPGASIKTPFESGLAMNASYPMAMPMSMPASFPASAASGLGSLGSAMSAGLPVAAGLMGGTSAGGVTVVNPAGGSGSAYPVYVPTTNTGTGGSTTSPSTTNSKTVKVFSAITDSTTPVIQGAVSLSEGEILTVRVNGKTYQSTDSDLELTTSNGLWTLDLSKTEDALEKGRIYDVEVFVADSTGQILGSDSSIFEISVSVDSSAVNPNTQIEVTGFDSDGLVTTISGTAFGESQGHNIALSIDGKTYASGVGNPIQWSSNGVWSVDVESLELGKSYEIKAILLDESGLQVAEDSVTRAISLESEVTSSEDLLEIFGERLSAKNTIELFGRLNLPDELAGSDVKLLIDGELADLGQPDAFGFWSFDTNLSPNSGSYDLRAYLVKDNSIVRQLDLSAELSTKTTESLTAFATSNNPGEVVLSGYASLNTGEQLVIRLGDQIYSAQPVLGVWSLTVEELPEAAYNLSAEIRDSFGNIVTKIAGNSVNVVANITAETSSSTVLVYGQVFEGSSPVVQGAFSKLDTETLRIILNGRVYDENISDALSLDFDTGIWTLNTSDIVSGATYDVHAQILSNKGVIVAYDTTVDELRSTSALSDSGLSGLTTLIINSLGSSGGTTTTPTTPTENPSIDKVSTNFNELIGNNGISDSVYVNVATTDLDGEDIQLDFIDANGAVLYSLVSASDASKALFSGKELIDVLGALSEGEFDIRAVVVSDVTLSKSISLLVDKTPPESTLIPSDLVTEFSNDTLSVEENLSTSTAIFTMESTDNTAVTYSLSGIDAAAFTISSITGAVKFKTSPDYESGKTSYSISVTSTDEAGNASTKDLTVNIVDINETPEQLTVELVNDTTNDVQQGFSSDKVTNDARLAVTNQQANATVEYRIKAGDNTYSEWSSTYSQPTIDGIYTVDVRQVSATGDVSEATSLTFTLDTLADITDAVISGLGELTQPTNIEVDATVEYRVKSVNGTFGNWSSQYTKPTENGDYVLEVRQTDKAGNQSNVQTINFAINPDVPTVDLLFSNTLTPTLTGFVVVPTGSEFKVEVNGATYKVVPDSDGHWSLDLSMATPVNGELNAFVNGQTYDVRAFITDGSTERNDTTSDELTVDTQVPLITLLIENEDESSLSKGETAIVKITLSEPLVNQFGFDGDLVFDSALLSDSSLTGITLTGGQLSNLQATADSLVYTATLTPNDNFEGVISANLTDQVYIDQAGNSAKMGIVFNPDVDTKAPVAPTLKLDDLGVSNSDGLTSDYTVALSGIETSATVEYSEDSGVSWANTLTSYFNLSQTSYQAGQILARQTDSFGNVSEISTLVIDPNVGLTIDKIKPIIQSISVNYTIDESNVASGNITVTYESDLYLSGTISELDFIQLTNIDTSVENTALLSSYDPVNGVLTFNFSALVDDPAVLIQPDNLFLQSVVVADAAGNIASKVINPDVVTHNLGPSILSLGFETGTELNPEDTFTVTTFGLLTGQQVKLSIGDVVLDPQTPVSDKIQVSLSSQQLQSLTDGVITVKAEIVDGSGVLVPDTDVRTSSFTLDSIAPEFASTEINQSVFENTDLAEPFLTVGATDVSDEITYALDPTSQPYFVINSSTGAISVKVVDGKRSFDFENLDSSFTEVNGDKIISLTVIATDGAGNTASKVVNVTVKDVDETSPTFTGNINDYLLTLEENSGESQVVFTASDFVNDLDDQGNVVTAGLTYSFKDTGDADAFSLNPTTGALSLNQNPNFEGQNEYSVTLVARDTGGNTAEQAITLNITDVVEPTDVTAPNFVSLTPKNQAGLSSEPADINENTISLDVLENTDPSSYEWLIKLDDPFATLSFVETTDQLSVVKIVEGAVAYASIKLLSGNAYDYESFVTSSVRLRATDAVGNTRDLNLSINVLDDGFAEPVFDSGNSLAVAEGTLDSVYFANATSSDNNAIKYTLTNDANGLFTIDEASGVVSAVTALDYDASSSYSITVRATNGTEFTDKTVTLTVNDFSGPKLTAITWGQDISSLSVGDSVPITLSFDSDLTLTNPSAFKLILVDSNTLGEKFEVEATQNASDSTSISFLWTVPEGIDVNDTIKIQQLLLSGGSITGSGGAAADIANSTIELANLELNTVYPKISDIELTSEKVTLTYSEPLVIPSGSSIEMKFADGSGAFAKYINSTGDAVTLGQITFTPITGIPSEDNFGDKTLSLTYSEDILGQVTGNPPIDYSYAGDATVTTITAGEFISTELSLQLLDLEGNILSETEFNPLNGIVTYADLMPDGFSGKAIVRVVDTNGAKADYLDEYSGSLVDLSATTNGFGLRSFIDYQQGMATSPVSVTPLSELIVRLAYQQPSIDIDLAIQKVSELVDIFFGIDGSHTLAGTAITEDQFNIADGISTSEFYGVTLAALSALDGVTGSIDNTLNLLTASDESSSLAREELITQAIENVLQTENTYMSAISEDVIKVLDHMYNLETLLSDVSYFQSSLDTPETALDELAQSELTLDLSEYLEDDYELVFVDVDSVYVPEPEVVDIAVTSDQLSEGVQMNITPPHLVSQMNEVDSVADFYG